MLLQQQQDFKAAASHVGGDHNQGEHEAETHISRRLPSPDYEGVENGKCNQE